MELRTSGVPKKDEHRRHIQHLWPEFTAFANARGGARYVAELPQGTPFADWSHHDRYSETGFSSERAVEEHRRAARGIQRMVRMLDQDGTA